MFFRILSVIQLAMNEFMKEHFVFIDIFYINIIIFIPKLVIF
jgi:hypothetical protein